jgi:hypothetical protein
MQVKCVNNHRIEYEEGFTGGRQLIAGRPAQAVLFFYSYAKPQRFQL